MTDEPVPRLPRGRGMRFSRPEVFRIVGLAALLAFLLITGRPCADSVSRFVTSFGGSGSAAAPSPLPGTGDVPSGSAGSSVQDYESLRPGMSEAELKAAIERARARAHGARSQAGGAGSAGSNAAGSAGSDDLSPSRPTQPPELPRAQ
jgi:hypothetical protein